MIFGLHWGSRFVTFSSPGPPKWSKDVPKREKSVKRWSPGKGLEKDPCLEGVKPLKMTTVTHFQLFFKGAWVPKKGAQMEAEMVPKSIRSSPRAPLGLLWGALELYFWYCFFSTIFQRQDGSQNGVKMELSNLGASLSNYPPSPSRTLPLSTSPKGYPNDLQGPPDAFRNLQWQGGPESVEENYSGW